MAGGLGADKGRGDVERTLTRQGATSVAEARSVVKRFINCWGPASSSVQAVSGVDQPGIDVLAHRGQHEPEKPAVPASGAGLEEEEVILLAFDRAFGAGAGVLMTLPKVAVPGDEGMESEVLFGIGVDDSAVR